MKQINILVRIEQAQKSLEETVSLIIKNNNDKAEHDAGKPTFESQLSSSCITNDFEKKLEGEDVNDTSGD